ncbi:PHP domain-containing protein [Nonomuraea sp. NPDC002799]
MARRERPVVAGVPATLPCPVDLHLHTRCSDGDDDPATLARRCVAAGLRAVSVTDHNTMAGVERLSQAAGSALTVVPGCEVTAEWDGAETHCLAYFVDPGDLLFQERVRRVHDAELRWWRAWAERVAHLGAPLTWEGVARTLGGDRVAYVGDYLTLLIESGDHRFASYTGTAALAADWCRPGRPLHLQQPWRPGLLEVLAWIAEAGGVAVLAHPGEAVPRLERLCDAGLGGLEVWTSWHTPADSARLAAVCARLDLVATAGSDYHGTRVKPWVPGPGLLPALPPHPLAILDALHARRPTRATSGGRAGARSGSEEGS